ncbi:MAG: hypothetical protein R6X02_05505 [Enhygromyxa sp.]
MELEQLEALALSADREQALAQLIPGTEDYYFHRCLEHLHRGELDATEPLFAAWVERHGETARVRELRDRRALLRWERDPAGTCEHLRRRLGVTFTHQRELEDARSDLPTRLDPARIDRSVFMADALRHQQNLDGFEDRAFEWLIDAPDLGLTRVRALLKRLARPDYPGLVELIAHELDDRHSSGFGSFPIHTRLTLAQLDQLAALRPRLRQDSRFVETRLARLLPEADVEDDLDARAAHLAALWAYVEPLVQAFNSLKLHVLYHQLELDRRRGVYDRASFERYIALPRNARHVSSKQLHRHRGELGELHRDYRAVTGLGPVKDDAELLLDYLFVLFSDPALDDHRGYAEWLEESYLRRVFAETKILIGQGDPERWYSLLDDPSYYQALEERVEITLAPQNPRRWAADEPVELLVDLKHVPTLVVKVFEINPLAYFLANGREVDGAVDLDGLVANDERVLELEVPALRRVRHTLRFDELARPGTFVIELIGNGKSSRAVIRKGALNYLERRTAAGHALTILDEAGQPAPEASAWFGGREFRPDERGELRIPYGAGGQARVLLRSGSCSTVVSLEIAAERYEFDAGVHVEREQLIAGATAEVAIAATLTLAGVPVDPSLIGEPTLTISSQDRHEISSSVTIPLTLDSKAEAVHRFTVPEALRRLSFEVRGKVRSVTEQREVELSARRSITINELDLGSEVADLHLSRTAEGHVLHVLGKSGEARAGVEVALGFTHLDFRAQLHTRLQTDARGRIELGGLLDIRTLHATLPSGRRREWTLVRPDFRLPAQLHTAAGRELALPRPSGASVREAVSLLERCGEGFRRECNEALTLTDGGLRVGKLEPGTYELTYKLDGQRALIRVGPDQIVRGWSLGDRRQLELTRAEALRVTALTLDEAGLRVQLEGVRASTRVHVFARRYLPDHDPLAALDHARVRGPAQLPVWRARSLYLSGRDIGDEYRYILDRKRAEVFPGNMLERPGLLLNPWALRTTSTGLASPAAGGAYAAADEPMPEAFGGAMAKPAPQAAGANSSNLDFLPDPAGVFLNLRPDAEGCVTLPREQLGEATLIRAVAVDSSSLAAAELALPEAELHPRDRRLLDALDPAGHFVLRKRRACLAGEAELRIDDLRTAKLEAVDSVGKAHALLLTLSSDPHLREFEFVTRWPSLSPEQQRERYSKYACHELHLFLARKDPEFFAAVVQPYLADKRDKTFMDHYLLGDSLDGYLEPWAYSRLNALEKILLAERIAGERGPGARHIGDRFDLLPPDLEGDNAAFDTALQGSALASDAATVFAAVADQKTAAESTRRMPRSRGVGGPPPPPGAPPAAPRPAAPAMSASRKRAAAPRRAERAMELEISDEFGEDDDENEELSRGDLAAREQIRRFFQPLDKTQEWAENNYYRRKIAEQGPELISVNAFWRDFAEHVAAGSPGPFLSGHFVRATSCFAELLCALAVLDLPFTATPPERELDESRATFRAQTPLIVFHEQITPTEPGEERLGVLVSQNYFRADDRYRYEDNERHDKYVTGEFLIHTVYICQIVLTNPSSSAHKLDLLVQIPQGAIPVGDGFETRDLHVHLQPRGTHAIEYSFYFPTPGRFEHFPVHVARHEALVVFAEPSTLEVVTRLRSVDTESWSHVSQQGSDAEVLAYLEANNVDRLALERIAWRMREREMFDATLALLRRRHVYSEVLWSYALHHRDPLAIGEYLRAQEVFLRGCGLALESPLLRSEPVERRWYQHLEYAPLVNARAHQLGRRRKILNSALEAQYRGFLQTLIYHPSPSDDQLVAAAYYALLQDRVRAALQLLDRVDPERVTGRLQWDYLQAYVALYRDDLPTARALAERHREHPVPRWRKRFANLAAILAEAEGAAAAVVDEDDRQQQQAKLAATEASFDFELEGDAIVLSHQNLRACQLSFYRMDIELLFSRQPFMQDQSDRFAIVQPNFSQRVELGESPLRVELPAELRSANTIVEVVAGGVRRSKANYAHDLAVRTIEQYGQLRVQQRSSGRALARAYVKVYARKRGGAVDFYKDGYTDLRGAFDYASLSTNELDDVERFAILVMSEDRGALIREVAPPQR